MEPLTPELLLAAYANGYFPMALEKDDPELYWFSPEERGVIPLDTFNVPRGLKRAMKERNYTLSVDKDFVSIIRGCAEVKAKRKDTWINEAIIALYGELAKRGHAHSIEVWNEETELVGGLYGVSLGDAFFGESMFSRAPDASKLALVTLVNILRDAGYRLLDTQYVNDHLKQFGVKSVRKKAYMAQLAEALEDMPGASARFSAAARRVVTG